MLTLTSVSRTMISRMVVDLSRKDNRALIFSITTSPHERFCYRGVLFNQYSVSPVDSSKRTKRRWTKEELLLLNSLVGKVHAAKGKDSIAKKDWEKIAAELDSGRTAGACRQKYSFALKDILEALTLRNSK